MSDLIAPWLEKTWTRLQQTRAANRLPHAMLFAGMPGLGKTGLAEMLARSLLCASPDHQGLPCGSCRSCHYMKAGTHPDFLRLEPEDDDKPIRIDAVRELTAWSVMTPQEGSRRVTLIVPAERMNPAAANSLLKTLEEPAGSNLIILVSARPALLPATIRSRCQTTLIHPPDREEAVSWLASQQTNNDWGRLLRLAGGAPLTALELARSGALGLRNDRFMQFGALVESRADPLETAASWAADGLRSLEWLASWLRDIVRIRFGTDPERLENPDLADALQQWGGRIDLQNAFRIQDRIAEAGLTWRRANLNPQLQMEDILITLAEGQR